MFIFSYFKQVIEQKVLSFSTPAPLFNIFPHLVCWRWWVQPLAPRFARSSWSKRGSLWTARWRAASRLVCQPQKTASFSNRLGTQSFLSLKFSVKKRSTLHPSIEIEMIKKETDDVTQITIYCPEGERRSQRGESGFGWLAAARPPVHLQGRADRTLWPGYGYDHDRHGEHFHLHGGCRWV